MLNLNSLTNTLTLCGVLNIRYRVYSETYQKSSLLSYLTHEDFNIKNTSYKRLENSVIDTFQHLIELNIPCVWQIVPNQEKDYVSLELWVFWFDDRQTGIIDDDTKLKELKEQKVGSFHWEQLMSNGLSPTASPQPNRSIQDHIALVPNTEYRLFIKSVRNLIHHSMIQSGAFTLGEFFIFPDHLLEDEDIIDSIEDQSKPPLDSSKSTMLAFMYNIYLTSSNLVFQPNTRRMRIRHLSAQDNYIKNKKVLLSPTGEYANLVSFQSLPTLELQKKVLEQWAEFYHLSCTQLTPCSKLNLPSLVTIRCSSGDIITYPSVLIFVPTDTKISPTAVAGLNGIMGLNHGLTEDLGSKLSRFSILQPTMDYWTWRDPMTFATKTMIDSLSMLDTNYQQDQVLLHRALIEPVISSPIMNSKSVIPIDTTPLLGNAIPSDYKTYTTPPKSSLNSTMNLNEFATYQFKVDEPVEAILDSLNPINDPNVMIQNNENLDTSNVVDSTKDSAQETNVDTDDAQQDTVMLDQPAAIDNFNLMYNNADSWNEDFADLDLDITEADFDFFETPHVQTNNVLNIIPIEHPTIKKESPSIEKDQPSIEKDFENEDITMKDPDTPNHDSLFTPFVISQDGSEEASVESSGNITIESMSLNDKKSPQKKNIFQHEHPCFVPKDFLPVPIHTADLDAKYEPGGKFMYDPSNAHRKDIYSPDYVPTSNKKDVVESIAKKTDIEIEDTQESNGSDTSDSSSTTSSSSSDMYPDDSDTEDSNPEIMTTEQIIDKRLKSLLKFQKNVVYGLLKATPAALPTDRFQSIDYDTPFTSVLADGYIKPIKWRQSKAMEKSIEYLCQQAIWGGYPFTDGIFEVVENEDVSCKILMARRTNIMQITRGVVTHVPSLQIDAQRLLIRFKSTLKNIFLKSRSFDDVNDLIQEEIALRPYTTNSMIDVKGPLTIQQYYNLNETYNQTHSKYGKYQIKKKRPDDPNFNLLKEPDIIVSRHEDFIEASPKILPLWEKLGLEPCSSKKQIKYLVVYPDNRDIEASVHQFFKNLSTVYDTCHLGKHTASDIRSYRYGLVPVPIPASEDNVKLRLKSYEETCENVGRNLAMYEDNHHQRHLVYTVIYIVNPGPHISSYLDMCRCFYKLIESYRQVSDRNDENRIVLQLIPIEHILRSSAFSGYTLLGMKDISFSVYTKCLDIVSRKKKPEITTELYAPPFILSKAIPKTIPFKLNDIRAFPILLDQDANLHMAYCFSYDRAWMSVVWIDGQGELLEYGLFSRKTAYKEAWERTLKIAKGTDFPWTIVLTKVGLMFHDEFLHWMRYISNSHKYWVTIVSIDLETGLNLHFNQDTTNLTKDTNNSSSTSTVLNSLLEKNHINGYDSKKLNSKDFLSLNQVQSLVLNHRISYSQKRERAYKGILRTEAITEKERWTTPLATGYIISHSIQNKNVNPCIEQFNNEPFVAEIHLLYNHTQHSAYITLQDIIKRFYALSFINPIPSNHSCIPFHIILAERLSRLLLIIDDTIKNN